VLVHHVTPITAILNPNNFLNKRVPNFQAELFSLKSVPSDKAIVGVGSKVLLGVRVGELRLVPIDVVRGL